jgi:hypothetical protein
MGTSCTESVWDASSQTLWIRHSFAPHSITSSARASSVGGAAAAVPTTAAVETVISLAGIGLLAAARTSSAHPNNLEQRSCSAQISDCSRTFNPRFAVSKRARHL